MVVGQPTYPMFLRLLLVCVLCASPLAATAAAVFSNPGKQLKGDGLRMLQRGTRVLIPTVYAQNLIAGVHKASKGGAHAKVTAANPGITPDLGRLIADELQADLVAKLQAAGCEVLTYADVQTHPVVAGLKPWAPHKTHRLPIASINVGFGDLDFLVSTPTGVPVQQHATIAVWDPGIAMRYARVAKEKNAVVVVPTYRFQAPVLHGSARSGLHKSYASAGIAPSMQIPWAGFQLLSAKGAWGSYMLDGVNPVLLADTVGTITKTSESKSTDTSLFDFSTFRSMAKSGYLMEIDADAYRVAAIAAGKELNTLFVAQFK